MSYPTVVSFIVNRLLLGLTYFVAIHGNYDSILIELGLSLGGGFLALVNLLQLRFLHYSIGLLNFMVTWAQACCKLCRTIIIIIIERKDYGGVLSKTARTPNSFESACVGAPDQKLLSNSSNAILKTVVTYL